MNTSESEPKAVFSLRLTKQMHDELRKRAAAQGKTMTALISSLIEKELATPLDEKREQLRLGRDSNYSQTQASEHIREDGLVRELLLQVLRNQGTMLDKISVPPQKDSLTENTSESRT